MKCRWPFCLQIDLFHGRKPTLICLVYLIPSETELSPSYWKMWATDPIGAARRNILPKTRSISSWAPQRGDARAAAFGGGAAVGPRALPLPAPNTASAGAGGSVGRSRRHRAAPFRVGLPCATQPLGADGLPTRRRLVGTALPRGKQEFSPLV